MQYFKFTFLTLLTVYYGNDFFSLLHNVILDTLDYFLPIDLNDDGYLTTMQLCEKYGYQCEEHFVQTPDGYNLAIHRIVGRTKGPKVSKKSPTVFVLHGIFSASTPFILDAEKSPGGILSDNGLDVWIGNCRGNRYSRNHTTLSPDNWKFWDYSSLDVASKDLSTMIDYVLHKVNKKSVHFVGYSLAGYMISGILAYRPEFNEKIQSLTYLASSSMFKSFNSRIINSSLYLLRPFSYVYGRWIKPFEYLPYTISGVRTSYRYFNKNSIFFKLLWTVYEDLCGNDNNNTNIDRFPYYIAHMTNGVSFNAFMHVYQSSRLQRVEFEDHGPARNTEVYGQATSPNLDYTLVKPPKLFIYGTHDHVIPKEAVLEGVAVMKNVKKVVKVEGFNHFHFMYSRDLKRKVYDHVTNFIKKYD